MSVEAEVTLRDALAAAQICREIADGARQRERNAIWHFIHEARRQHWSWNRIGKALGVTDNAVKSYYDRNRTKVT